MSENYFFRSELNQEGGTSKVAKAIKVAIQHHLRTGQKVFAFFKPWSSSIDGSELHNILRL